MIDADNSCTGQISEKQRGGSNSSAEIVLKEVWKMVAPTGVLEVGYTDTHWQRAAQALGAQSMTGVWDPLVGVECESSEFFTSIQCAIETEDWRTQFSVEKQFDLVISLKAAAILSAERTPFFIEALCESSDLVLFSGSLPGLANAKITSTQSLFDWNAIFQEHNFACFDILRPALWDNPDVEWQFLQNALLFARRGSSAFHSLAQFGQPVSRPMVIVHPQVYAQTIYKAERHINELEKIAFENPFGRGNHIRTLEDKIGILRSFQGQADATYKDLSERYHAVVTSRSWKFTSAFRALSVWFERGATTD